MLELGAPLEMIQLLQTPWEERFKVRKQKPNGGFYQSHLDLSQCKDLLMAARPNGIFLLIFPVCLWKGFWNNLVTAFLTLQ